MLLEIFLDEFGMLAEEHQDLLRAIDVERESYDDFAARTGVSRPFMPQKVLGARLRLYAAITLRLA